MENFKCLQYLFAILFLLTILFNVIDAAGCDDNESCTDLCGVAGAGECINKSYCKCEKCPQRSIYELVAVPKVCTLDPTCVCPPSTFSVTSGKIYSGHRCISGTKLVCICFCMPTTLESLVEVVKCPFPKPGSSHSSNATSTTGAPTTQPSA